MNKVCSNCHKKLDIDVFSKHFECSDGHLGQCKFCINEKQKIRYKNNPQKYLNRSKKWRKENPEKSNQQRQRWASKNREKSNAIKTKWRINNLEKSNECSKNWRINNPEKMNANGRKWRKENYEKWSLINRRNQYKRRLAIGRFTNEEWLRILKKHDNSCAQCGTKEKITIDHIIPISKGGANWANNLQPLCLHCNVKKYNKVIERPLVSI